MVEMNRKFDLYSDSNKDIIWNAPMAFNNDGLMMALLISQKKLKEDNRIKSVYGAPSCNWNGGRTTNRIFNLNQVETIISTYNELGISVCLTFNRYRITEENLNDEYCNGLLDILSKLPFDNWVIISSDLLYNHIKRRYPDIKTISSVLRPTYEYPKFDEGPDYYSELLDKYDRVVVRPEFNNIDFISKIKDPSRLEILVNQSCRAFCTNAIDHYDQIELFNTTGQVDHNPLEKCGAKDYSCDDICRYSLVMNREEIQSLYDLGVRTFKIQGRGCDFNFIMSQISTYVYNPTIVPPLMNLMSNNSFDRYLEMNHVRDLSEEKKLYSFNYLSV